jgi:hypothetical protein
MKYNLKPELKFYIAHSGTKLKLSNNIAHSLKIVAKPQQQHSSIIDIFN